MTEHQSNNEETRPGDNTLAIGAARAAARFDVSARTWARWDSAGKCPHPFKLGGTVLWRVADLEAWSAAGFPDRAAFEALRRDTEVSAVA